MKAVGLAPTAFFAFGYLPAHPRRDTPYITHHTMALKDPFKALRPFSAGGQSGQIYSVPALEQARDAWVKTALAWESLAAVSVGPLVERRSLRSIDFQPLRPDLLKRMMARQPRNLDDMQRVGTPAKGLPALEHLLWSAPVEPGTPGCTYAVLAAQEVHNEANALREAFNALASAPPEATDAGTAFAEFINQWLGGLERLRWPGLEKPLREAQTRGGKPSFARAASGQTVTAWRASCACRPRPCRSATWRRRRPGLRRWRSSR